MSMLTRMTTVATILSALAALGLSAEVDVEDASATSVPAKRWVWLESQGVWGYGYQLEDGPQRGLWRIDPETKVAPPAADPYGFAEILNGIRAAQGLPPAVYDPELSSWAVQNNVAQS